MDELSQYLPHIAAVAGTLFAIIKSIGANLKRLADSADEGLKAMAKHREDERGHWLRSERLLKDVREEISRPKTLMADGVLQ